jgi:hypothetical protein
MSLDMSLNEYLASGLGEEFRWSQGGLYLDAFERSDPYNVAP